MVEDSIPTDLEAEDTIRRIVAFGALRTAALGADCVNHRTIDLVAAVSFVSQKDIVGWSQGRGDIYPLPVLQAEAESVVSRPPGRNMVVAHLTSGTAESQMCLAEAAWVDSDHLSNIPRPPCRLLEYSLY